jgi:succinylglutamic semialdehyde dehydrogenase
MGGNNPMVVHDAEDLHAAVTHTLLSAFITAGQRCTCARRLIVVEGARGDDFVSRLVDGIEALRVGLQLDEPAPFMGPLISSSAADAIRAAENELIRQGGRSLVPLRADHRSPALLHPGLVDVTTVVDRGDQEVFGPLLQLVRVRDFDAAIEEANRTAYGLAAALLSDDAGHFDRFLREVRAGVVNWNRQTTGASGRLPFGGLGRSGNHRPAGAWAADYCSDPVATLESSRLETPASLPPGLGADRA